MLCVIAKIDDASRARLDNLCKIAEEFNFPARYLYGHITLVSYVGDKEAAFIGQCKAALRGQPAFSVCYSDLELLTPTPSIVASPDATMELRFIHRQLAKIEPSELDSWSSEELWHPHTTLFYHTEANLQAILERMKENFVPFPAEVSRIEFSRVTESGYQIIDFSDLKTNL